MISSQGKVIELESHTQLEIRQLTDAVTRTRQLQLTDPFNRDLLLNQLLQNQIAIIDFMIYMRTGLWREDR